MNVVQNKKATKRKSREYRGFINFDFRQEANPEKIINHQVLNELNSTANNSNQNAIRENSSSSVILSLTEGRGQARGEVGIAALDIQSPVLILCQLSDGIHYTDALNKIQVLNPTKILIPDTIFDTSASSSKLVYLIRDIFPNIQLIPVQRRHFNDKSGFEQISTLCSQKSFNLLQIIARKYYCLSSAGALLSYLKNVSLMNFAAKCLKIDYQTKGGMMIDTQTSVKLELLYSLNFDSRSAKKLSLYGLLNKCETSVGQRHLRANILEPSCDIEVISKRHEQIKIFIENETLQTEMKEILQKFKSAESLLKVSCISADNDPQKALQFNIHLALLMKNILEAVNPLALVVSKLVSEAFEDARRVLSSKIFGDILKQLDTVIQPNIHENRLAQKQFQYIYAVKTGVNQTVDFLRQLYSETVDEIRIHIANVTEISGIPAKMIFTPKLGYHLLLKDANLVTPPANFELIHRKGNNTYLTTPRLMAMNDKIRLIEIDLMRLSSSLIYEMLLDIAKEIDAIYCLIGVIIEMDIAQSLAEVAMQENYCCPVFSKIMRLEDAYHPVLQSSHRNIDIIKNNVIATPQYNFYLITGPNMSGKTIYIKMVAVIQVMAQIGSFVPAKSATIRMCDKIFSRLGFQDSLEQNASSFTVELRDMEYIYSNLTPNSLVIIDELCRSTAPNEGEVLCYAFCEKLLNFIGVSNDDYFKIIPESEDDNMNSTHKNTSRSLEIKAADIKLKDIARPFIYMTTHFDELSKLAENFNNTVNLHMLVQSKMIDKKMRLDFKYKIQPGPSTLKSYGLALANSARFPSTLIDRAEELLPNVCEQSLLDLIKSSENNNHKGRNVTLNKTSSNESSVEDLSDEILDLERDVIDLYSHILLHMSISTGSIEFINIKLRELIDNMTPNLRKLLKESSLDSIIGILNMSSSRDESS
ncbi:hypothetical protein PVAND_013244 [Polypedilum vanderplanki]|uniref:DNA mismatch repair proteins mutS family domain-containing protein n=1 Tax=Polypedilum vanderplanki TaxID=319348 RepID=A0A9J6CQ41_POLVA|nr:hypothetical protein PVAND_013244 [Polypedilum vanderplanki]